MNIKPELEQILGEVLTSQANQFLATVIDDEEDTLPVEVSQEKAVKLGTSSIEQIIDQLRALWCDPEFWEIVSKAIEDREKKPRRKDVYTYLKNEVIRKTFIDFSKEAGQKGSDSYLDDDIGRINIGTYLVKRSIPCAGIPTAIEWVKAVKSKPARKKLFIRLLSGIPEESPTANADHGQLLLKSKIDEVLRGYLHWPLRFSQRECLALKTLPPSALNYLIQILDYFADDARWCLKNKNTLPARTIPYDKKGRPLSREAIEETETFVDYYLKHPRLLSVRRMLLITHKKADGKFKPYVTAARKLAQFRHGRKR